MDHSSRILRPDCLKQSRTISPVSKTPKHLIDIRRAEHLVLLDVVREREGIGLLQPKPLARCNDRDNQRQRSQDISCDREAGTGIVFEHGIHDAAPGADKNDEDQEGVNLAGREGEYGARGNREY
jgi:hypothetical protein